MKSLRTFLLPLCLYLALVTTAQAEQFVLIDEVFTFEEKDAVPTKSHIRFPREMLSKDMPKDWTQPVNYRNGTLHIRYEVLEKPPGEEPTIWSICYIPVKGRNKGYGCAISPIYSTTGVFEKDEDMTKFWENDSVIWTEGINLMTLVMKSGKVKSHAHLQPDLSKFFPTKIHVTLVQVSEGSTYDPSQVPALKMEKNK